MSKKEKKHEEQHEEEVLHEEEEIVQEEVEQELTPEDEIAKLNDKVAQLEDQYLRANAEFENLRKRMEKEKYQAISYAHEQFAKDLLPVIDALEIAINSSESDEGASKIKEGIGLTIEQFKKCFEKHGIKSIQGEGDFDPNVHEAVMQIESDEHEAGQIVQVFQKGYTIKERILRPAMVSIAK
jgi:molecular chaperone GrpE